MPRHSRATIFHIVTLISQKVRQEYAKHGFEFLLHVFNEPEYLENLVGFTEMMEKQKAEAEAAAAAEAADDEGKDSEENEDDFMLI